ncbi:hypothetical protein CEH05_12705 [Halobacillus halophilus]|uniref:Uncharacterized protein n=1 Tax=Halobacillus halophilus (strain ATCC 35676 / DSM 2266 / JCM 20832 / KCTC 3685 / LMG 17431 / NBRC 102448 / NCIMB 2269) TaxID=866895 RepID=I0JP40_HALH3|nr:hypothetical protein [Halobacillus halophilus]ASF39948.1 hypothetical protein CEH05_12705 [Halobacillus halophilus]CCG45910.1 hypothetical protein HBHAL_3564 [Halobacillus halophilus DSM 2266]
MGELFELLFSNFLIVAAVIGGIISFFSRMGNDQEDERKQNQPGPSRYPSAPSEEAEERGPLRTEAGQKSLQEYYEEQQEKIKGYSKDKVSKDPQRTFTYETPNKDIHTTGKIQEGQMERYVPEEDPVPNLPKLKKLNKWDKKRLAEGVLAAEILGQPRAYKPHQSHPRKR